MLLDHGAAIRRIHEELVLLRELLRGGLPPPRASLPASSAAALPMSSTGPFAMEMAEKMLTRQASAVVWLQAAARGFLVRRRLQKAHKQMRDQEAALAVVAFAFDAKGCDLDTLDG
jgi:predicted exporter